MLGLALCHPQVSFVYDQFPKCLNHFPKWTRRRARARAAGLFVKYIARFPRMLGRYWISRCRTIVSVVHSISPQVFIDGLIRKSPGLLRRISFSLSVSLSFSLSFFPNRFREDRRSCIMKTRGSPWLLEAFSSPRIPQIPQRIPLPAAREPLILLGLMASFEDSAGGDTAGRTTQLSTGGLLKFVKRVLQQNGLAGCLAS